MSKTRDTGFLANVIQVHDTGVRIMSGSTMLMAVSSSGAVTITGEISGSDAANSLLLSGTGSVGFTTTSSFLAVSSSQQQVSASYIALSASYNTFSGSASTRITVDSASLLQVSSSQQQISASLLNVISIFATTGSNSFRANQSITGSLVVSSTITAQTLVVQTVTSSIVYSSGSNIFGCDLNSRQTFTGSLNVTGSNHTIFGNVGIGTSSPNSYSGYTTLTINNTTTGAVLDLNRSGTRTGTFYADTSGVGIGSLIATNLDIFTGNSYIAFQTCGLERMRITSGGIACFACQVCAPSFIGGTMSGTTLYGSTAVCSPVGKFTTCLDLGGALTGTSAAFSSTITGTTIYGSTMVCAASLKIQAGFADLVICGSNTTPPHIGGNFTITTNQDALGRTIIGNSAVGRAMYLEAGGTFTFLCAATFNSSAAASYYSFTGAIPSSAASTGYIDYSGGGTRFFSVGTSGATKGAFSFYGKGADDSSFIPLTITSTGIACFACQVCAPSGVKFGSGATTLNYYEQGTFTPTIQGSSTAGTGTYSHQIGVYTKIGNLVTTNVWINWSAHTGTGDMLLANFPFTSIGTSGYRASGTFGWVDGLTLSASNVVAMAMTPSSTNASVTQYPAGGGAASGVPMDASANLHFAITYQTT